jgi:hypothetical protein
MALDSVARLDQQERGYNKKMVRYPAILNIDSKKLSLFYNGT